MYLNDETNHRHGWIRNLMKQIKTHHHKPQLQLLNQIEPNRTEPNQRGKKFEFIGPMHARGSDKLNEATS